MGKPMTHKEVIAACYDEWRRMHHNASISRYYPNFQNEYENEMFWDILGDDTTCWIEDLKNDILEIFGFDLTFYSYGRNGATIAPHDWSCAAACGSFGRFNSDRALEGEGSGLEGYRHDLKVLKCLKFINEYWHDTAAYVPQWWKDAKEANESWQGLIDEHDGMTKRMVEVWVPTADREV